MKNQLRYSVLALVMFLVVGCSKKEDAQPRSEALLKTWQTQEVSQTIDGQVLSVYLKGRQTNPVDYAKSRLTFKPDGTFFEIVNSGTSFDGTWELTENDQKIVFDGSETYTINQLSDGILDISKSFVGVVSKKTVIQQEKLIPL